MRDMKERVVQIISEYLHLREISPGRYRSQWGTIETLDKGGLLWAELHDRRVIISLEEREDLKEYVEESVRELIPYDIIKGSVQYKMF